MAEEGTTPEKWDRLSEAALQRVLEWAKTAEDFAQDQAPLVVEEIIDWGLTYYGLCSAVSGLVWLALVAVAMYVFRLFQKGELSDEDDYEGALLLSIPWGFLLLVASIAFCHNIMYLLYIWVAPRLYVIERIRDLIN